MSAYEEREWPHSFGSFPEAQGWTTRIRAEGSKEAKAIAAEVGVSLRSINRAVRTYLIAVGEYDPTSWRATQRVRKAEARRRFIETCKERDRRVREENALAASTRSSSRAEATQREVIRNAFAEHRRVEELEREREAALGELHVSSPTRPQKLTRGQRQRRLNARTRRYAGA